jgi:hypothetical protein
MALPGRWHAGTPYNKKAPSKRGLEPVGARLRRCRLQSICNLQTICDPKSAISGIE